MATNAVNLREKERKMAYMEKDLIISANNNRVSSVKALSGVISFCDITFVFSGQLRYIIDGEEILLKSNDGICIAPGMNRIRLKEEGEVHYFSINFLTHGQEIDGLPVYMPECLNGTIKELLLMLGKMHRERIGAFSVEKKALMLQLLLLSVREQIESQSRNPYVNMILAYIHAHFQEDISLQDIADTVHLTVPYCCSLVKNELDTTIYRLILKERLQMSTEYILNGGKSLQEIASLCGFHDYSHFSKYFKKYMGTAPSQYRAPLPISSNFSPRRKQKRN